MVDEAFFTALKYVAEILQEVIEQESHQVCLNLWRQLVKELELFDDQIVVIAKRAKQVILHLVVESWWKRHGKVWPFKIHEPNHYSLIHFLDVIAKSDVMIYQ